MQAFLSSPLLNPSIQQRVLALNHNSRLGADSVIHGFLVISEESLIILHDSAVNLLLPGLKGPLGTCASQLNRDRKRHVGSIPEP